MGVVACRYLLIVLCAAGSVRALDSPGTSGPGLPKIAAQLTQETASWTGRIKTGEQSVDVDVTIDVKVAPEGWVVTHVVSSPAGDSTDIAVLDKETLESIGRESKHGQMTMKLDTRSGKVKGSITVGAQSKPIEADAGGPLFADGIAGRVAIPCLPLAEGYTTTYRTFDPQQMKARTMELKVAGSDTVTVPAGTFDAFRVEVRALDGPPEPMTLWVAKKARKAVKVAATIGPSEISAVLQ